MKCPACSKKKELVLAQAYFEGKGILPVRICTSCGFTDTGEWKQKTLWNDPVIYCPNIPEFTEEQLKFIRKQMENKND